jgi:hypothetical protein
MHAAALRAAAGAPSRARMQRHHAAESAHGACGSAGRDCPQQPTHPRRRRRVLFQCGGHGGLRRAGGGLVVFVHHLEWEAWWDGVCSRRGCLVGAGGDERRRHATRHPQRAGSTLLWGSCNHHALMKSTQITVKDALRLYAARKRPIRLACACKSLESWSPRVLVKGSCNGQ